MKKYSGRLFKDGWYHQSDEYYRASDVEGVLYAISNEVDSAADRIMLLSEIEKIQNGKSKLMPQDVCDRVSAVSVRVMKLVREALGKTVSTGEST